MRPEAPIKPLGFAALATTSASRGQSDKCASSAEIAASVRPARGHALRHALPESLARRQDVPFAQQNLRFTGMGEREAWIGSNSAVERHDRAGIEGQCLIAAEYERVPCGRRRRGQCKPISICQHDEASPMFVLAILRLRRAVMEDIDPRSASVRLGRLSWGCSPWLKFLRPCSPQSRT